MKIIYYKAFLSLSLLFYFSFSHGATYYVSASGGNDNFNKEEAQHQNTPWRTLLHINQVMNQLKAGDIVLFKRGEVFSGTLNIQVSGSAGSPIVFGAYGDGALPELTGFVQLYGWIAKGIGVWETTVPNGQNYENTVTLNGVMQPCGRYPNAASANSGYLGYDSYNGNTSITDKKLSGQPNWTGGQIVMRKARWIIDRSEITSQAGNTINYNSATGYGGAAGYGYFIQNHPATLDIKGEWYYQADSKKLGIFTGGDSPDHYQIRAGVTSTLININNQNNLRFEHLRFTGAMQSALEIASSQNITISDCEMLFSGKNAINATNSNNLTVESTSIAHTNNNAFNINNCNGLVLNNNQIKNTAVFAGMGENGDGAYEGIQVSGNDNLISANIIDSTGYIPLNFGGDNVKIKNNVITNFTLTKDDGGGIYTWNNGSNAPQNTGRVVTNNIVLNGIGAPGGTDNVNKAFSHGIYMDDNAGQVEVSNNTVANCATYGVFIHNAHDISIKNNTMYNNAVQLYMEHDNVAADKPIYNCTVASNTLFAKTATQLAAAYKTKDNDIASFGAFDNNSYYRPLDNDLTIGVLKQVNGTYSYKEVSLETWKSLYGKDANSVPSTHNIPAFTVNQVTGSNQFTNSNFDANAGGLYAYAAANNCTADWAGSSPLDGGALKVSFSSTTGSGSYGSIIIGIGAVTSGKTYRVKFSMLGGTSKAITTYLRQSGGSYSDLSARLSATISSTRTEKTFLFTANASEANSSIVFDVPEQSTPLYLDNIILQAVQATATNPDQFISFFYNPNSLTAQYSTNGQSYDAAGKSYPNGIKLNAYSSAVLVQDTAATKNAGNVAAADCTATGTILREQWDNIGGTSISDIPLNTKATSSSKLTSFEGPLNVADNYGSRIRGYICPPQTGSYTFWLATDDAGELWLSTDDQPVNKIRIANVDGWTNYHEWNKYASQKSVEITLQAGKKYYVEALQKEGGGGDNLSVQWQLPDASMETPIAGNHLSPYVDTNTVVIPTGSGSITRDEWANVGGNNIADIPLQNAPTSTAKITSFEGPLNAADNYGSRIRGYIFPPQTGSYTFWIATDDAGELWLSTDDQPANKTRIANVDGYTDYRQWNKFASQKSVSIALQAGKKYYIEALQKEGAGGDNLSVQWQLPNGTMETPIAGIHLSPYVATMVDQTITFDAIPAKTTADPPFNLVAKASSGLPVSFNLISGPATLSGNTVTITGAGTIQVQASQAGNADFNAVKTALQSFTVTAVSTTCSATGTILREQWNNVSGNNLSDFGFQTTPASTSQITTFEGPVNIGDNYASRIRGYICAPQTGIYTFWLAGDDAAELYISTNDDPNNKVQIANVLSWTNYREWTKFASQKSGLIALEAGKKYYVEAIHKEGGGGDNISVQWQLPNGTIESPLPGKYLSPYVSGNLMNTNSFNASKSIAVTEYLPLSADIKIGLYVFPNPVSQQSSVEFTLPSSGQTNITLYNSKGQMINSLYSGTTQANSKTSFVFSVGTLQSGVYVMHLQSGAYSYTKKVIVVK